MGRYFSFPRTTINTVVNLHGWYPSFLFSKAVPAREGLSPQAEAAVLKVTDSEVVMPNDEG